MALDGNKKQNALPYERVMALIVRLLDTTFIRIGNETSREDKEKATYGLSTMQDEHIEFASTEIPEEVATALPSTCICIVTTVGTVPELAICPLAKPTNPTPEALVAGV